MTQQREKNENYKYNKISHIITLYYMQASAVLNDKTFLRIINVPNYVACKLHFVFRRKIGFSTIKLQYLFFSLIKKPEK